MKEQTTVAMSRCTAALMLIVAAATAAPAAGQQAFHVITYFDQAGQPTALIEGSPGVFYSTASLSPYWVLSLTAQGAKTFLASFSGANLAGGPNVAGADGRFYGFVNPSSSTGSVFSIASVPGSKKVYPAAPISPYFTQNLPDGALLGMGFTFSDVYLLTGDLQGNTTTFYQFPSGESPLLLVLYASDGNYYGVSVLPDGSAYVYRATSSGSVTKIYSFPTNTFYQGTTASLIQASDGSLYGTTSKGGNGYGSIYKLTLGGQFTSLYSLPPSSLSQSPEGLLEASDGNLYGATTGGDSQLFRITKSGAFKVLQTLNLYTQGECYCWLIQGSDGNLYGAASMGGIYGAGDFFELALGLPTPKPWAQHFHPSSGPAGANVRIWGRNLFGASVQFNGAPATAVTNSGSNYVWAAVPAGATTGPLTIATPGGSVTTTASFTVE